MKQLFIGMLAWAGIMATAWAQDRQTIISYMGNSQSPYDMYSAALMRHQFTLFLGKGNLIKIEVSDKQGLDYITNIDSLISTCSSKLMLLKDSFQNELHNLRIDYLVNKKGNDKIRLRHERQDATNYAFQDGELLAVKVNQDTLRITGHYTSAKPVEWSKKFTRFLSFSYRVTIILNNMNELPTINPQSLNWQVQKIKNDWDQYLNKGNSDEWGKDLNAYYNLVDSSKNRAIQNIKLKDKRRRSFLPYFGFTLQNMQTYFTPSVQLGADLSFLNTREQGEHYLLYLEKFFFRQQNINGKSNMMINNFLTFQYRKIDVEEKKTDKLGFNMQFSLGYLVTRAGTYFEKNSFHLCVPGIAYRNLQLTPGLFFNNLFNQTSPTLSLTLYLE